MDLDASRELTTFLISMRGTVENENLLSTLIFSFILVILGCFPYFLIAFNMGSFMFCVSVISISLTCGGVGVYVYLCACVPVYLCIFVSVSL